MNGQKKYSGTEGSLWQELVRTFREEIPSLHEVPHVTEERTEYVPTDVPVLEKVNLSFSEEGATAVTSVNSRSDAFVSAILGELSTTKPHLQDDLLADFNLRRAVVWAEILHPKFEEY